MSKMEGEGWRREEKVYSARTEAFRTFNVRVGACLFVHLLAERMREV